MWKFYVLETWTYIKEENLMLAEFLAVCLLIQLNKQVSGLMLNLFFFMLFVSTITFNSQTCKMYTSVPKKRAWFTLVTVSLWYKFDTFIIFISTIMLELGAMSRRSPFSSHAFFLEFEQKLNGLFFLFFIFIFLSSFYHFSQSHLGIGCHWIWFDFGHTILFQSNLFCS